MNSCHYIQYLAGGYVTPPSPGGMEIKTDPLSLHKQCLPKTETAETVHLQSNLLFQFCQPKSYKLSTLKLYFF